MKKILFLVLLLNLIPTLVFAVEGKVDVKTKCPDGQPKCDEQKTNTGSGGVDPIIRTSGEDVFGKKGFVICGNYASRPCTLQDAFNFFILGTNYLVALVGLAAVLSLVVTGFMYAGAVGNQEQLKTAKSRLTSSIIGLILVLFSFVIINSLLSGSISIGVKSGACILLNPVEYIQNKSCSTEENTDEKKKGTMIDVRKNFQVREMWL